MKLLPRSYAALRLHVHCVTSKLNIILRHQYELRVITIHEYTRIANISGENILKCSPRNTGARLEGVNLSFVHVCQDMF